MTRLKSHPSVRKTLRPAFRLPTLALASALALSACATTGGRSVDQGPTFPSQRTQRSLQSEFAQARRFDDQIQQEKKIFSDRVVNDYVKTVVARLEPTRPRGAFAAKVRLIEDDTPNAFTIGGGYLYIHTGLLEIFENEAQLAMVLGHEMAHGDADHITEGTEARQMATIGAILSQVAGAAVGGGAGDLVQQAGGIGVQLGYTSFSRDQEREADSLGFSYLADAGYDVRAGATAFQALQRASGGGGGGGIQQYLSTHPLSAERFRTLSRRAAAARPGGRVGAEDYRRRVLSRL